MRGICASGAVYTFFTHADADVDCILAAVDETFSLIKKALKANDIDTILKCFIQQQMVLWFTLMMFGVRLSHSSNWFFCLIVDKIGLNRGPRLFCIEPWAFESK